LERNINSEQVHFVGLCRIFILQCAAQKKHKKAARLSIATTTPEAVTPSCHVAEIILLHLHSFTNNPFHFRTNVEMATSHVYVHKLPQQQTQQSCAVDRDRVEG